jgi:hypothetical protein
MPAYETYLPALYQRGPQRAELRSELSAPGAGASQPESGALRSPVLKVRMGAALCCMNSAHPSVVLCDCGVDYSRGGPDANQGGTDVTGAGPLMLCSGTILVHTVKAGCIRALFGVSEWPERLFPMKMRSICMT